MPAFLLKLIFGYALFGYAHFFSKSFSGYAFCSATPIFLLKSFSAMPFSAMPATVFYICVFIFRPCMPIAQMRLAVRGGFSMFSRHLCLLSANYNFLSVQRCVRKKNRKTTYLGVLRTRGGRRTLSFRTQNAGVYSRGNY